MAFRIAFSRKSIAFEPLDRRSCRELWSTSEWRASAIAASVARKHKKILFCSALSFVIRSNVSREIYNSFARYRPGLNGEARVKAFNNPEKYEKILYYGVFSGGLVESKLRDI